MPGIDDFAKEASFVYNAVGYVNVEGSKEHFAPVVGAKTGLGKMSVCCMDKNAG